MGKLTHIMDHRNKTAHTLIKNVKKMANKMVNNGYFCSPNGQNDLSNTIKKYTD